MLKKFLPNWLFRRGMVEAREPWCLSQSLFKLSKRDDFRIRNSVEGVAIFGGTGGGKTSGSGHTINQAFLRAGMGGLVLCAKSDEARMWQEYAREAGRSDDVILFSPEQPWRFNFMGEELRRKSRGGGDSEVIVKLLNTIAGVTKRDAANGGGQGDAKFWEESSNLLLKKCVDLVAMAKGNITISDLYDVLDSAPKSIEQTRSAEWQKNSPCYAYLKAAYHRATASGQQRDFQILDNYWMGTFPELADKTRSILVASITPLIDLLNREPLRQLFCGETNITPQAMEEGKIIIVDLPVTQFNEMGKYAAAIWKLCTQRCLERRDVRTSPRPVFIWQDEAQHFVLETDMMFQTTCRSYRVCNVVMTQNISNFYAVMGGGEKSKAIVDSLLGTLNTKIFHCNGDSVTNQWMAEQIGRSLQTVCNSNISHQSPNLISSGMGFSPTNITSGVSQLYEWEVQPGTATTLRTGGPANHYEVEAIVFSSGMCFAATGRPYLFATFKQK
jgi:TraM recognition site of TraD and TraG